jgi:hypothetical protein
MLKPKLANVLLKAILASLGKSVCITSNASKRLNPK